MLWHIKFFKIIVTWVLPVNAWNLTWIWGLSWKGLEGLKYGSRWSSLISSLCLCISILMLLGTCLYPQGEAWWRKIISASSPHIPKTESAAAPHLGELEVSPMVGELNLTSVASPVDLWKEWLEGRESPLGGSEGQTGSSMSQKCRVPPKGAGCPRKVPAPLLNGKVWAWTLAPVLPGFSGPHPTLRISELGCGVILSALFVKKPLIWMCCCVFCLWFARAWEEFHGLVNSSGRWSDAPPLSLTLRVGPCLSYSVTLWCPSQS